MTDESTVEDAEPIEEVDSADSAEEAGEDVAEDLDAILADLKRERDEYLDLARRAKADFDNYRKRAARETAEAEVRGKAALAREVVPSIDNLERALAVAEDGSEVARGVALVHGELQATLARAGVESYAGPRTPGSITTSRASARRPTTGSRRSRRPARAPSRVAVRC